REDRKAGRKREGFLHAGEHDVHAIGVHVHGHGGEGGNRVHDEHGVREGFHDFGDGGEVVEHAGGGLRVDEGDGVEAAFSELGADGLGIDLLAPFDLHGVGFVAALFRDIEPLV